MELPDNLKFIAVLIQGGAFKAQLQNDSYPRYYFVLNRTPLEDEKIVLITSTTHFELHKNSPGGDDIHIPLSKKDYEEFTQECLICCNRPRVESKEKLKSVLRKQQYIVLKGIPGSCHSKNTQWYSEESVVQILYKTVGFAK